MNKPALEQSVELNENEWDFLVEILKSRLDENRVERRHTATAEFRDRVDDESNLIRGLLSKIADATND